tara:strand:+ start:891 stop:1664 length:774 start_codon:yes stop_codon:yes gene_type:complete
MSIDFFKKALAANGLPTSGNKEQMLQRLMSGQKDKRKKTVKAEPVIDATEDDDVADDSNKAKLMQTFCNEVAAELRAEGHTDDALIHAEVMRRFKKEHEKPAAEKMIGVSPAAQAKKSKKPDVPQQPNVPKPDASSQDVTLLDFRLSDEHAKLASLKFVCPTGDDRFMYVKDNSNVSSKRKAQAEPSIANDDGKLSQEFVDKAVNIIAGRLFKKAKVKAMSSLLEDFGVDVVDSDKESVVRELSQQLIYETDDDDEP